MAATNYFEYVIDPSTGQQIEVRDRYAREQLVHKTEKTVVNSLPAKPTTYDAWLAMERFIYFVPIDGHPDQYEAWTLFFIGNPSVPADYTDTDNYEWAQLAVTDTDLSNFSTKGHTHEVVPEVSVDDHEYTPQGTVQSQFTGGEVTTSENTHNHQMTPHGTVSGQFSGSSGTTDSGTTGVSLSKVKKKLSTKKLNVSPATSVNFTGSTTNAQRATGALESLSSYDASKAVFNGIDVTDGVLSFVTKKMTTADTVSGLSGTIDASKVTYDSQGTVTNQDLATGAVEDDANGALLGTDTGVTDGGHTHTFTPAGSLVNMSFSGTTENTENATHSHTATPAGTVSSNFSGARANLKHNVDNKKVRTAPDSEDEGSHAYDWYGILFDEDEDDPQKTRVGNMDMHRMLPIQTKMRRCLLNDDGTVNYYLDDRDSTKKAGSQEGWVTSEETFMSKIESDDVRGDVEYLNAIEGHSVVWNQLIKRTNNSSTLNNVTFTAIDGGFAISTTNDGASANTQRSLTTSDGMAIVKDHKYYFHVCSNSNIRLIETLTSAGMSDIYGSMIKSASKDAEQIYALRVNSGTIITEAIDVTPIMLDLTLMFGAGNEPTTVEAFEAWLAANVGLKDYYDYNAGSIVNAVMTGVKTTFDGGSNTYPFDVTKIYGQLNGEGELVQVYPNGMLSAGTVKDVLTKDSATVNVGRVDMGNLAWQQGGAIADIPDGFMVAETTKAYGYNILCDKYPTLNSNFYWGGSPTGIIGGTATSHKFFIKTYDYADVPTFKAAVSGSFINYELATPLTYTNLVYRDNGVDTPLTEKFFPNGIVVGKGGTVEIQPQNTESIVTCAPTLTMKKYVLQAGATLNGADGQVMVEIPEHWRKVYTYLDGAKTMVKAMISPYPQETTGWIHVKKGYISAYEANIDANNKLCSTSDIKDLVLSVVNGKVNATCDVSVIGETGAPADWSAYIAGTHSQFPTTSVTLAAMRTAARARHTIDGDPDTRWNQQVYEQYLTLYWLYIIEYANLNSQADINTALDYEGFHQGGLGAGVTTVGSTAWNNFNAYKPFVPCGITNCLGNHTGEVILSLPSAFGTNIKVAVNSYRGVEMPFGHIFKFADGIKYLGDGTQQAVLRCGNPANYSSASNSDNYTSIGNNIGSDGYKTKIMIGDDGDINCKAVGGGALKAYCDYNSQAHTNGTYSCCLLGGRASGGAYAGLACVYSSSGVSDPGASVGSRLCFFEK